MSFRKVVDSARWLVLLAMTMWATALIAQEPPSKVDIFTGYSWLHLPSGFAGTIVGAQDNLPRGATVNATYYFGRNWGLSFDGDWHACRCDPKIWSFMGGPTYRFPGERVTPFLHASVGLHRMKLGTFGWNNDLGAFAGGGLDVNAFRRVAIRVIQADYAYARHDFGSGLGTSNMHGVRLAAGFVWRFGSIGPPPLPASAACSVQPSEIIAGEPVTVTATGSNFNPNRTVRYAWSGTGVKVSGSTATTQVDTTGLAPGSYQVAADLNDGSRAGVATCNASFTVRAPRGPAITCRANPTTVQVGGSSNITSSASSPDNRPLTYSYGATAGSISGSTASTTLNTEGAAPGSITVNCNVADDRSPALTANAATTVMVEAMPVAEPATPPAIEASQMNQIDFKENSPRVDNAAKAILDDVALRLQREPDAKAVLVGLAGPAERRGIAAQRAHNAKAYLVNEKGIDASRIETRTGSAGGQHTQIWLVPAGATFNTQGTESAEPSSRRR